MGVIFMFSISALYAGTVHWEGARVLIVTFGIVGVEIYLCHMMTFEIQISKLQLSNGFY